MMQNEIRPAAGARRLRRRVGRGTSSGHGKTSGRGMKGQKSRSGGQINPRFEGGQLPIVKRLPFKRGFVNIFRVEHAIVKVGDLERFDSGQEVSPEDMVQAGLLKSLRQPVKVLGEGVLSKPLVVSAHKFSAVAKEKIEAAGGRVVEIAYAGRNP